MRSGDGGEPALTPGPPTIAIEGGRLRPWQPVDAPRLVTAWADPEVARWNAVPPEPSLANAQRWIAGAGERWQRRLAIDLVIDLDDGGVMGEVGLSGFSADYAGALVGYWLLQEARGRGVATRALQAFVGWAHSAMALDVVVARCHRDNPASQAVAARSDFRHEANDPSGNQLWRSRRASGERC